MSNKQVVGLIGSILLLIGVFTPIVSVPVMGEINYFRNGEGEGVIVLILAVISLVLVLTEKFKGLWFTSLSSLAVMFYTFAHFENKMSEMRTNINAELAGNPFADLAQDLAQMVMQSIQLEFGWGVLISGSILLIISAVIEDPNSKDNVINPIAWDEKKDAINNSIDTLSASGYKVVKKGAGWVINEPLGGKQKITSVEELEQYAKQRA